MAELDSVDLKLNLTADDQASEVLESLAEVVAELSETLRGLADNNPFAQLNEDAGTLSDALEETASQLSAIADNASGIAGNLSNAADSANTLAGNVSKMNSEAAEDPFGVWADRLSTANTDVGELLSSVTKVESEGSKNPFASWTIPAVEKQLPLEETIPTISESGSDPYSEWLPTLSTVKSDITEIGDEVSSVEKDGTKSPFSAWAESIEAVGKDASSVNSSVNEIQEDADKSPFSDWVTQSGTIVDNLQKAASLMEQLNSSDASGGDETTEPVDPLTDEELALMFQGSDTAADKKTPNSPSKKSSSSGISDMISTNELMGTAMNAMMGYYAIQGIASSANSFQYIQQLAQMNNLDSSTTGVNQAAQDYAMLGAAGMSGSSATGFLTGLSTTMQKAFTSIGTSGVPETGLLLEKLGLSSDDAKTSPWMMLQNIAQQYQKLINSGQGSQADELLSLTGTTQAASVMQNWGSLSNQMSNINLGMSPTQLNQEVGKGISLQGSLQELSISFDQLDVEMVPAVKSATSAFTELANTLTGKGGTKGVTSNISSLVQNPTAQLLASLGVGKLAGPEAGLATAIGLALSDMLNSALKSAMNTNWWKNNDIGTELMTFPTQVNTQIMTGLHNTAQNVGAWAKGLWKDTEKDWEVFEISLGQWAKGLWNGVENIFDIFTKSVVVAFQGLAVDVEKSIHSIPIIGNAMVSSSTLAASQQSLGINELSIAAMEGLPTNAAPGTAQVVNHSGVITVQFQGGTGLSRADQTALQNIVDQLYNKLKLTGNFDISY